jgi:hypothetical protein
MYWCSTFRVNTTITLVQKRNSDLCSPPGLWWRQRPDCRRQLKKKSRTLWVVRPEKSLGCVGGREGLNVAAHEDGLPPTLAHDRYSRSGLQKQ